MLTNHNNKGLIMKKINKQPPQPDLVGEITVVPQGAMVKPRTFIVTLKADPLRAFLEKEIMNNSTIRAFLKKKL